MCPEDQHLTDHQGRFHFHLEQQEANLVQDPLSKREKEREKHYIKDYKENLLCKTSYLI